MQRSASSPVLAAIDLLSPDDRARVAVLLHVSPAVEDMKRAVAADPRAGDLVLDYLFEPARSKTPPRQMLKVPCTPPPVHRTGLAARRVFLD